MLKSLRRTSGQASRSLEKPRLPRMAGKIDNMTRQNPTSPVSQPARERYCSRIDRTKTDVTGERRRRSAIGVAVERHEELLEARLADGEVLQAPRCQGPHQGVDVTGELEVDRATRGAQVADVGHRGEHRRVV